MTSPRTTVPAQWSWWRRRADGTPLQVLRVYTVPGGGRGEVVRVLCDKGIHGLRQFLNECRPLIPASVTIYSNGSKVQHHG